MAFTHFSHNGTCELIDQAQISLFNIEYTYGFGVYESLRVKEKVPYFVVDHVERLMTSAQLIQLKHTLRVEQVIGWINELISKTEEKTYNLKILLIGSRAPEEAQLYILPLAPKFPDKKLYRHGARVITTYYERLFPQAKSLNMLPSYLAYREAQNQNAYDSLLIDREDRILEGTRTNFLALKDRTLFTPSNKDVLHGVARRNLIHIARENDFAVEEKDIFLQEVREYDAAMLTSTSSKVMPICEIGEFRFEEISPELKELMKLYDAFLKDSRGIFS
jgi:branched-subunit amino acid aminotransferase/4-amino-4-deoxychorismate lyase